MKVFLCYSIKLFIVYFYYPFAFYFYCLLRRHCMTCHYANVTDGAPWLTMKSRIALAQHHGQDASVTSGSNVADQTANLASWRMIICTAKHHSTWWTSVCQSRVSHQVSIFDLLLDDSWLFRDASLAHSAHVSAHVPSRSMAHRSGMHCQTVCEIRLLA